MEGQDEYWPPADEHQWQEPFRWQEPTQLQQAPTTNIPITPPSHQAPEPPRPKSTVGGLPQRKRRPRLRYLGMVIAAIVILLIGIVIGSSGRVSTAKLTAADARLATVQRQERTQSGKATTLTGELRAARWQASHALSLAMRKASAKYAAREAAVTATLSQVSSEKHQFQTLIGNLQASSISADGVYVVGSNIKAGTWFTSGDGLGAGGSDQCYFATLGSTNTSNILDNNNFDGDETVSLDGVYAFQISGGCTWSRTGN
jgi:hypothetical protein